MNLFRLLTTFFILLLFLFVSGFPGKRVHLRRSPRFPCSVILTHQKTTSPQCTFTQTHTRAQHRNPKIPSEAKSSIRDAHRQKVSLLIFHRAKPRPNTALHPRWLRNTHMRGGEKKNLRKTTQVVVVCLPRRDSGFSERSKIHIDSCL